MEPFFNSVVKQLGIPDIFSLQMCGAGLSASSTADPAGGSLVSNQEGLLREEFKEMNIGKMFGCGVCLKAKRFLFCLG